MQLGKKQSGRGSGEIAEWKAEGMIKGRGGWRVSSTIVGEEEGNLGREGGRKWKVGRRTCKMAVEKSSRKSRKIKEL